MTDLVDRLSTIESAAVADVMVAMGLANQVLTSDIRLLGEARIFGRALCAAGEEGAGNDAIPTMRLDEAVKPGDVVIISTHGYRKGALIGDNMVTSMVQRGARGFILDGGVRDAGELAAGPVPIYCAYTSPTNGHRFWSYTSIGEVITFPGIWGPVSIHPGDYILGDADGVCVLPQAYAAQIVMDAEVHMASEANIRDAIEAGAPRDQATRDSGRLNHVAPISDGALAVDD